MMFFSLSDQRPNWISHRFQMLTILWVQKGSNPINQMEISCALVYTQTHATDTQGLTELSLILRMWHKCGDVQFPYILKVSSKYVLLKQMGRYYDYKHKNVIYVKDKIITN